VSDRSSEAEEGRQPDPDRIRTPQEFGRELAAGSADGTVRLWDTSASAAIAAECADSGQPITRLEWDNYVPGQPYRAPCS
jgi:WD40 repeat protein